MIRLLFPKNLGENALGEDRNIVLNQLLIINHEGAANKGKIKGPLALEQSFGFCKTFKKITKFFQFHLTLKTASLQESFFTTIATDINVTINSLYLFVPIISPSTDTRVMSFESIQKKCTSSYDGW